jgi:predicted nucleic acid-binding protein
MPGLLVVDTSVWIDFARKSLGEFEERLLHRHLTAHEVVLPQLVWLELLVGQRSPAERKILDVIRATCRWEPLLEHDGWIAEQVAETLRARGKHLGASDLLIFCVARRLEAKLLHHDEDFTRVLKLPDFTSLRVG